MPKLISIKRPSAKKSALIPDREGARTTALQLKQAEHDFFELAKLISALKQTFKKYGTDQMMDQVEDILDRYGEFLPIENEIDNPNDRNTVRILRQAQRDFITSKNAILDFIQHSPILSRLIDIDFVNNNLRIPYMS